jgi:hypothetical protein
VPSPIEARPAGERLVGPLRYTVDARNPDRWTYFSFSRGSVATDPRPFDWDLAFRRFQIIVNGGDAFPGMGGVRWVEGTAMDSIPVLPEAGYVGTEVVRGDSIAVPLDDWYEYSFFSHLLMPLPRTYLIRTADGRYARLRFESYYCPGAQPGCVTFEYSYQGRGGRDFSSEHRSGESASP